MCACLDEAALGGQTARIWACVPAWGSPRAFGGGCSRSGLAQALVTPVGIPFVQPLPPGCTPECYTRKTPAQGKRLISNPEPPVFSGVFYEPKFVLQIWEKRFNFELLTQRLPLVLLSVCCPGPLSFAFPPNVFLGQPGCHFRSLVLPVLLFCLKRDARKSLGNNQGCETFQPLNKLCGVSLLFPSDCCLHR